MKSSLSFMQLIDVVRTRVADGVETFYVASTLESAPTPVKRPNGRVQLAQNFFEGFDVRQVRSIP